MQTLKAEFESAAGEALSGLLDVPDEEPKAYALFARMFFSQVSEDARCWRSYGHGPQLARRALIKLSSSKHGQRNPAMGKGK